MAPLVRAQVFHVEPPLLTIQALKGYEVTVRGETSVPRAELANLLFAAGAAVRVSRDAGVAAVEVHQACRHRSNCSHQVGPGSGGGVGEGSGVGAEGVGDGIGPGTGSCRAYW